MNLLLDSFDMQPRIRRQRRNAFHTQAKSINAHKCGNNTKPRSTKSIKPKTPPKKNTNNTKKYNFRELLDSIQIHVLSSRVPENCLCGFISCFGFVFCFLVFGFWFVIFLGFCFLFYFWGFVF